MNCTEENLERQFNFIKKCKWLDFFIVSADKYNLPLECLIAIASRETNINPKYQRVPGDNGHGFSIMQIDIRSYPAFCNSQDWHDPAKAIDMGASVLASKLEEAKSIANLHPDMIIPIAIAGYNCGVHRAATEVLNGRNPDGHTTGKDYSRDVLERAKYIKKLLNH